jgi:predicted esterase
MALLLFATALAGASAFAPPPVNPPARETLQAIEQRTQQLAAALDRLRKQGVRDPALAEIEVYHKAAVWILRHNQFYGKTPGEWTLAVLDRGLLRASQQARGETPWWQQTGHSVAHAYRSRLDGSVQPYAVTLPADYGSDRRKRYRIDVMLHGRDTGLTEVSFLQRHNGDRRAAKEQTWVQIDIYGRGNNAYRWAGENDVFEALDHFLAVERMLGRDVLLDTSRVVLRGFSMGGAGTWHLGLHRPGSFAVLGPGAGFTTTHGYVGDLPARLPDHEEACLHIYDAVDYAENAFHVPVVAYAGEDDKQLQAAKNIKARLDPLGIPMTLLIAPKLGHQFPPEWQQKAEVEYRKHLDKDREEYPEMVKFVTWTLKYPSCYWVEVLGLEQHYKKTSVQARRTKEGFAVQTANVRQLHLNLWPGATREPLDVVIDEQKLSGVRPYLSRVADLHLYLEKRAGKWSAVWPERLFTERQRAPQKVAGLQGPIDDAFTAPFLCVKGTGQAWNEAVQQYADADLARFQAEWSKYFRGDLPVKEDTEVTAEDVATRNLILFGDPGSNSLMAEVLPGLPLQWTRKEITLGGRSHPSENHVPLLIHPNPLASDRYVVINSGHTFHAREFEGTNALLYPRLGDHAILKTSRTEKDPLAVEVVTAGLFDDFWKITSKPRESR